MTPRANLLEVFRHGTPEWTPLVGHCDPYNQPAKRDMAPDLARALAQVQWGDESTVAFSRHLGLDIADWCGVRLAEQHEKVAIERVRTGNETVTVWHTPEGDLRQVQRFAPETGMWYTAEHAVKSPADLPRLASVYADTRYVLTGEAVEAARQRRRLIGDDGIILCPVPGTPLGQMIRIHAGVETVAYLWADARPELHALFAVMEAAHRQQIEAALRTENDAIVTVDDTSTTTMSPAMFEAFCLGYTDRMADVVHAAGRLYFHHSCGLIRDLLGLYRQTRMDAVHAFQVPPIGDVTIAQGRERLGRGIAIFASLVQMSGSLVNRAAVAESLRAMAADAVRAGCVVLNISADPGKTMAETGFVADECRKWLRFYAARA